MEADVLPLNYSRPLESIGNQKNSPDTVSQERRTLAILCS